MFYSQVKKSCNLIGLNGAVFQACKMLILKLEYTLWETFSDLIRYFDTKVFFSSVKL